MDTGLPVVFVLTAWSEKVLAKFCEGCLVIAVMLCIGCPRFVGRRMAVNSTCWNFLVSCYVMLISGNDVQPIRNEVIS